MKTSYKNLHSPHLAMAKKYWEEHLTPADLAIDATCGNGHDTLFLSNLLPLGAVFAFDIQQQAIRNTEALLGKRASHVFLHHRSHAEWDEVVFPKRPRLIVYNLGYLPKGDKQITTQTETTLKSIRSGLNLLEMGGAMSITCYPGHEEGTREEDAIQQFLATLPSQHWVVCHHQFVNKTNAPSLFWILKIETDSNG